MSKAKEKRLTSEQAFLNQILVGTFKIFQYIGGRLWELIKSVFDNSPKDKQENNTKRLTLGTIKLRDENGKTKDKEVYISIDDLFTHLLVTGQIGQGKSSLLINLAVQLIDKNIKLLFLDPHGQAIRQVVKLIQQFDKVRYFSLNQKHQHLGYNPLYFLSLTTQELKDLKSRLLLAIFPEELQSGYKVAMEAKFIIESILFFHNAYYDYLLFALHIDPERAKELSLAKQITFNDLANLDHNPRLVELLIEVLSFKGSMYYRPDLARRWLEMQSKNKFNVGMQGVIGRFEKLTSMSQGQIFFESSGFNVLKELRKGNTVLCDLSGLDEYTMGIVSKIIFGDVFIEHKNGIITIPTIMIIDEAKLLNLLNLAEIIEQARKFQLGLVLACQHVGQFRNSVLEETIISTIVSKIKFRSGKGENAQEREKLLNLEERHFIFETTGERLEGVRTGQYGENLRQFHPTEIGLTLEKIEERINQKREDIYSYFLSP